MNKSLQDQVQSLCVKLEMLAVDPGYIETSTTSGVRDFYEGWYNVNKDCIAAGHEDPGGILSFVAEQLRRLLEAFPVNKMTIGVLEVFPLSAQSAFLFGCYISKLYQIASVAHAASV